MSRREAIKRMKWNPGTTLIAVVIFALGACLPFIGVTESNPTPPTWWVATLVAVVVIGAVLNLANNLAGETDGY